MKQLKVSALKPGSEPPASSGVIVVSVGHAKEESLAHNVKADQPDDGFREDEGEGELQDKARDIPDIRKKSNKEVKY